MKRLFLFETGPCSLQVDLEFICGHGGFARLHIQMQGDAMWSRQMRERHIMAHHMLLNSTSTLSSMLTVRLTSMYYILRPYDPWC